jgi:signal transduction histidine kinase
MFKRFHDHVEGSGIGLFMVKRIIDNAGGKITVQSEEGSGTEFEGIFSSGYVTGTCTYLIHLLAFQ